MRRRMSDQSQAVGIVCPRATHPRRAPGLCPLRCGDQEPSLSQASVVHAVGVGDKVTALDVVTLVTAMLGALTGIAALAWQWTTWSLSGARIQVDLKHAWLGRGGAITGVPGTWKDTRPPAAGYDLECLAVETRNVGRMPASITGWAVEVGVASLGYFDSPWNKPLPHRLESGESVTWFVERATVESMSSVLRKGTWNGRPREYVDPSILRARVATGDGKTHRSKRTLKLSELPSSKP